MFDVNWQAAQSFEKCIPVGGFQPALPLGLRQDISDFEREQRRHDGIRLIEPFKDGRALRSLLVSKAPAEGDRAVENKGAAQYLCPSCITSRKRRLPRSSRSRCLSAKACMSAMA